MSIMNVVEQHKASAIQLRRQIHQNPEMSNKEFETTALIIEEMNKLGIEIVDLGMKTGVCAVLTGTKPGKTVALRADMDALPVEEMTDLPFASQNKGVCHSCGHDLHVAVLIYVAKVVNEFKDQLAGKVVFLFQPAEEVGTGAMEMIKNGVFEKFAIDEIVSIHTSPDVPAGMVGIKKGATHASFDLIDIVVKGLGGHGAHPYRCVDSITTSCYLVAQLQTIISRENPAVDPAVLSICAINGGSAYNVIPAEVAMKGTLRTFSPVAREKISEAIRRVSKSCCEGMRAECEVSIVSGSPPLVCDDDTVDRLIEATSNSIGKDKIFTLREPSPGSDDFAEFLTHAKGAMFRIGTRDDDPRTAIGLHNSRTVFSEEAIPVGAAVISQYVVEFLK